MQLLEMKHDSLWEGGDEMGSEFVESELDEESEFQQFGWIEPI